MDLENYELIASRSTKISIAQYESDDPFTCLKRGFTSSLKGKKLQDKISKEQQFLDDLVDTQHDEKVKRIREQYSSKDKNKNIPLGHRFTWINSAPTPHVTNIISPERPSYIDKLEEHAFVGSLLDEACKEYVATGVLAYPEQVTIPSYMDKDFILPLFNECYKAMSKNLHDSVGEIELIQHSIPVYHPDYQYCGELDVTGTYKGKPAIFDFKKTKNLTKAITDKYFIQMAAYAKTQKKISYLVILSPFSAPIVTDRVGQYFDKFTNLRTEYKEKYGV